MLKAIPDTCVIGGLTAMLALSPLTASVSPASQTTMLIFPPWTARAEAIRRSAAAGARLVKAGPFPNVVVVHFDAEGAERRAASVGAWAVETTIRGCPDRTAVR